MTAWLDEPTDTAGRHVRFTSGASVSPDGSAFAHIVDDGGYPQAVQRFLAERRTSSARWVRLPVDGPVKRVMYSPDGHWLALEVAPHGGTRTQVWAVTNDPGDAQAWLLSGDEDLSVELTGWDGTSVALTAVDPTGWYESRVVDPATQRTTVVDRRPLGRMLDAWAGDALIRTGPRGYRDVVLRRADGSTIDLLPPDPGATTDVGTIVDPARALLAGHRATVATGGDTGNGDRAVRVLLRSDHGTEYPRLLEVVVRDGRAQHRVLAEQAGCGLDEFCASADGSTVALLWNRRGRSELHVLDLRSGAVRDITLPGLVASQLSIDGSGGLVAVTVEGPGMPPSVQLVDARTGEWTPVEAAKVEIDWFRTPTLHTFRARDGVELSGWLHHGTQTPEPAPVVVYLHGGPEAQERPGYSYLFPALTAAGIDVFAPNVRGSSGSGRSYQHADERHLRWAAIDDVADCVRYLVGSGLAVPGRIGVAGRSYGGYLTYATLTRFPTLFAAGVATCGMSDLQSFYANTEPWIAAAAVPKYGDPDDDAELLRALSPIHLIDRLQAPLLAVHGAHDTNVPVSESEQAVRAVRATGGTAEFLLFDDEGHETVKRENRARLAEAMVAWFSRYLAPS